MELTRRPVTSGTARSQPSQALPRPAPALGCSKRRGYVEFITLTASQMRAARPPPSLQGGTAVSVACGGRGTPVGRRGKLTPWLKEGTAGQTLNARGSAGPMSGSSGALAGRGGVARWPGGLGHREPSPARAAPSTRGRRPALLPRTHRRQDTEDLNRSPHKCRPDSPAGTRC